MKCYRYITWSKFESLLRTEIKIVQLKDLRQQLFIFVFHSTIGSNVQRNQLLEHHHNIWSFSTHTYYYLNPRLRVHFYVNRDARCVGRPDILYMVFAIVYVVNLKLTSSKYTQWKLVVRSYILKYIHVVVYSWIVSWGVCMRKKHQLIMCFFNIFNFVLFKFDFF